MACDLSFIVKILKVTSSPQCKNFENRLRFDKVRDSLKVGRFFKTQCINYRMDSNQILCNVKTQVLFVGSPKMCHTNPRRWIAAILNN